MAFVAVCGIKDYRNELVLRLNGGNTICAYLVMDDELACEVFDYKPVLPLSSCCDIKADYFVMSYKSEEQCNKAKNLLREHGIEQNRILSYRLFHDTITVDTYRRYECEGKLYKKLIIGMSHAKSNIRLSDFYSDCFSFASPSMDLFCHYMLLQKIKDEHLEQLKYADEIFIELPYYAFNYDLSAFKRFFPTKMLYFHNFADFHNFNDEGIINSYDLFYQLFIDKNKAQGYLADEDVPAVHAGVKQRVYHMVDMYRVTKLKDKVWTNSFEKTYQENLQLWNKIIDIIRDTNSSIKITLLITPFNPLFIKSHKKEIAIQKEAFYKAIGNSNNIKIVDCFEDLNDHNMFLDQCHLTKMGSSIWTKELMKKINA